MPLRSRVSTFHRLPGYVAKTAALPGKGYLAALVLAVATAVGVFASAMAASGEVRLEKQQGQGAADGRVEIHGVQAGRFDPKLWQTDALHWVAHEPAPILQGRNIYAPTVVRETNGWQIFYGGWDLGFNGNDHIFAVRTPDFRSFTDRRMIVSNGQFQHACNCSVVKLPNDTYYMLTTCLLPNRLNKPCSFRSPDARKWNGSSPYAATRDDLITIEGDKGFVAADINGMNVVLFEDGMYRLYYCDFKRESSVWRASSKDGKHYRYDGVALAAPDIRVMVNDVKKFTVEEKPWYLMALHQNGDKLWYSVAQGDGLAFKEKRLLTKNQGAADRYIVAVGLVCDDKAVYGFLYGASPTNALNTNNLFAKWLQKRVELFSQNGIVAVGTSALGPDRVGMKIPAKGATGRFRVFSEDGKTELYVGPEVTLRPGDVWQVVPSVNPASR